MLVLVGCLLPKHKQKMSQVVGLVRTGVVSVKIDKQLSPVRSSSMLFFSQIEQTKQTICGYITREMQKCAREPRIGERGNNEYQQEY